MKVRVNPELCTACGLCEDICPEVFVLGDDMAEVKVDQVPEEHWDSCRDAVESCPTEAIEIIEE